MFEKIEEVRTYLYKYLETRADLLKIEMQEHFENMAIRLFYSVILLLLISMTGIFVFIMIAVLLNEYLESRYAGFAIVFGFLLASTLFWIKAKDLVKRLVRLFLFHLFKDNQS
ncbi:MAG: phage holin family protein [Spirosomataceae bacterium]